MNWNRKHTLDPSVRLRKLYEKRREVLNHQEMVKVNGKDNIGALLRGPIS
jgi:hypothetical protein